MNVYRNREHTGPECDALYPLDETAARLQSDHNCTEYQEKMRASRRGFVLAVVFWAVVVAIACGIHHIR